MATTQTTIDFLLEQLAELPGVRAQKMFGEYALYLDEKVVALVCDNQLFVKPTAPGRALLGASCREGEAYPGAKPSFAIEDVDDADRLCELVRITAAALPAPRPKKKKPKAK